MFSHKKPGLTCVATFDQNARFWEKRHVVVASARGLHLTTKVAVFRLDEVGD